MPLIKIPDDMIESGVGTSANNLLKLDSSGNLGIGSSTPNAKLDIEGDFESAYALKFTNTKGTGKVAGFRSHGVNGETFSLYQDGYRMQMWDSNQTILFETSNTERMRITSTGKVLLGGVSDVVASANAPHTLNIPDGLTFGGSAYTYASLHGSGGNVVLAANAYPANTNSTSTITFKTASASGGQSGDVVIESGKVGIGTTNPTAPLHILASQNSGWLAICDNTGTGSDANGLLVHAGVDSSDYIFKCEQGDGTNVLSVKAGGNVGIGTTSPVSPLHVNVSGDGGATITSSGQTNLDLNITGTTDGCAIRFGDGGADNRGGIRYQHSEDSMRFYTNGGANERMRIDSSGNLVVGAYSLADIDNTPSDTGVGIRGGGSIIHSVTGGGNAVEFKINGTGGVGSINCSGSSTSYGTSSDYRLKENVTPMSGSIDRLKALKPSRFNFIADADTTVDGFLAHEAQAVVPECVTGEKDAMMMEDYEVTPAVMDGETVVTEAVMGEREVPDMQGIDQSKLVPLLVGAIQELTARLEVLENK
jgi:hypothetical protein